MTVKEALSEGNVFISIRMDSLEDIEYDKALRVEVGTEDFDDIMAPVSLVFESVQNLLKELQIENGDRYILLSEKYLTFHTSDFFDEVDMRIEIPTSIAKIRENIIQITYTHYCDLFRGQKKETKH